MKKLALALCILAIASGFAYADHPEKQIGIGVVGGGGVMGGDIGLALKLPSMPIFWGVNLNLNSSGLGLRATGDYYFIDEGLFAEDSFKLDWFLGLGGYLSLGLWSDGLHAGLGARAPVGLSWHITKEFELWLDLAPSLGLGLSPLNFPEWNVAGELGFRMWLR